MQHQELKWESTGEMAISDDTDYPVLHFMRGWVKFFEQCPTFYKIGYDLPRPRLITSGYTFKT